MPRTYDLHLTFGQMETVRNRLQEECEQLQRLLEKEDLHETMRPRYQLDLERLQGVLDQF